MKRSADPSACPSAGPSDTSSWNPSDVRALAGAPARAGISRRAFVAGGTGVLALLGLTPLVGRAAFADAASAQADVDAPERTTAADLPVIGGHTTYPYTYTTYDYNRNKVEVTVEKAPERVVAAYQNNVETLLALGLGDRIVCAFGLDDPNDLGNLQDAFDQIPYLDSRPGQEEVIGLEPDFIAAWYSLFADDRLGDVPAWHKRGCGTYMSLNSSCRGKTGTYYQTIYDEMRDIQQLGVIFDRQDEAQKIVNEMLAEVEKIADHVATLVERPSVAVLENEDDSYRVYSEMTLGGNVAMEAGAQLAVGKGSDTANISAEDLIAASPDAVFMVWYDGFKTPDEAVADIADNARFASLSAVREGKVFPCSLTGIYCSGLHTLDGIRAFSEALYPELYEGEAGTSAAGDVASSKRDA